MLAAGWMSPGSFWHQSPEADNLRVRGEYHQRKEALELSETPELLPAIWKRQGFLPQPLRNTGDCLPGLLIACLLD